MTQKISLLFAVFLFLPSTVSAASLYEDITPEAVYTRFGVISLTAEDDTFQKMDIALGTSITVVPERFKGHFELIIGPGRATFIQKLDNGLSAETSWVSNVFVSLLAGGRLTLFRRSWIDTGITFSYEATIFGGEMRTDTFVFSDSSGTYDITDFAKEHASLRAGYRRFDMQLDIRSAPLFDVWTAYAGVGITHLNFTLNLDIDNNAREMIKSIGQNPSLVAQSFDAGYIVPTVTLGSDVNLTKIPLSFSVKVDLIPVSIKQLFFGASLGVGIQF